ncbi:MAG: lpxK [Rickettsiaceae bacterium]|nr:lpxK [Rickettsiaceae bacterium]
MKAPHFWHHKTFVSFLCLPLSLLYLLGYFLNSFLKIPKKINKPVICIGNLVAGGAGKTPVAIAIGKILNDLDINFAYLSAGYGGRIKKFTFVDSSRHSSKDVGDEPLLLSETAQTFICKNKLVGAKKIAVIPNKKLILLDDGFQNRSLKKDFSILVIDGNYGFGNGLIIPAGPLREPIDGAMKKADMVIIVGEDKFQIAKNFCSKKQVIKARIVPINHEEFHKKSMIAFCGIGRPEKFFDTLEKGGVNVVTKFSYPDHHRYKESEVARMIELAKKINVGLITTKKDWVRLSKIHQTQIDYLDIKIEFEDADYLKTKLIELIN